MSVPEIAAAPPERSPPRFGAIRLQLLVFAIAVMGAAAGWVAVSTSDARPIIRSDYTGWQLDVGLLVLTCLAEVGYVRLRHGRSTEDLTFFEAVLVAAALLLPVAEALGVVMGGLAVASLAMRRPLVKTVFNLGSYATGASALLVVAHLTAGTSGALGVRAVLGLVAGAVAFAVCNLIVLSCLLAVVEGVAVARMLATEWQLSAIMAIGNAGAGMIAVEIALTVPALLPFVALPVLTLAHSYRSAVRHAEEQERNSWLATLGTVLAGQRDGELLIPVAETLRGVFAAQEVRIVLASGAVVVTQENGTRRQLIGHDGEELLTVLAAGDSGAQTLPRALVTAGCSRAIGVLLDLGPTASGALVIGWRDQASRSWARRWQSGDSAQALTATLVSVGTAVSTAIRAAEHLEALVEESLKLQAVVNHGTDGVAVLTTKGQILIWSPAMTRLTGIDVMADAATVRNWAPDPTLGDPVCALLTRLGGTTTAPGAVAAALSDGESDATVVLSVRVENDERRDLEISVRRIRDAALAGHLTLLSARDITEAARLERLKVDFIASISHELRTPITPIKGYAQLLITRGHLMEPARRLHALQLIEDRADHLSRLVDDLLLASRVGADESPELAVTAAEVDLRTVVETSTAGQEMLVDRTKVTLPAHPVMVSCDSVRAVQCLSNLLSNAVKYSPPGSPIQVDLIETESVASVSVTDWGRGIPAAELGRVFERFHRVDDAFTMQTSGSGLGLYIARELARAMHGDITLVSRLGSGSTLTLSLPRIGANDITRPAALAAEPHQVPQEVRR